VSRSLVQLRLISEAMEKSIHMPVDDVVERMFDLADPPRTRPSKLREAVLKQASCGE
jgi:hypothetical protein